MGEVYLARDIQLGRKVALKCIHRKLLAAPEAVDKFLLEARMTARFNHPHIVTVYAAGQDDGQPWVALEYLEGETLSDRLRAERPSLRESLRIGRAIADALVEAHGSELVHRDLKPGNVFLPKDGRLRVLDFGIARPLGAATELEGRGAEAAGQAEQNPGTPAYMAPEQWHDLPCSPATDVWALGVILYELVSGTNPIRRATARETAEYTTSPDAVPVLPASARAPAALEELIARCLEKDRAARPSAREVADALAALLDDSERPSPDGDSPFRGLLPFTERHSRDFFGREIEIAAFVEQLREDPVIAVVGQSGAGKSSFVQAGVIPRLREQTRWIVIRLRPGHHPFRTLASRIMNHEHSTGGSGGSSLAGARPEPLDATAPVASRAATHGGGTEARAAEEERLANRLLENPRLLSLTLREIAERESCSVLLFVDQLEEIASLVHDEQVRRSFMIAVCTAADDAQDPVRVIVTVRDDFLGRLARGLGVEASLRRVMVLETPGPEALARILTRPLARAGYSFDRPELVAEMITAAGGDGSSLPLLSFTAKRLWELRDRERHLLRLDAYEQMGGVAGALARHADGVVEALSALDQQLAREILVRLVHADGTRRVVSRARLLEGLPQRSVQVLLQFTEARLVSVRRSEVETDGDSLYELVHESLIRGWTRLSRWVAEGEEDLVTLEQAERAAELWDRRGRRRDEVWHGDALHEGLRALERRGRRAPKKAVEFLEAGSAQERAAAKRRRMAIAAGASLLAIVAAGAVLVALVIAQKGRQALQHEARALAQRAEAEREGARAALPRGSVLEARARLRSSIETEDSPLARALWRKLAADPLVWKADLGLGLLSVAYSPDGKSIAAGSGDHAIYLFDAETRAMRVLRGHRAQVMAVAFSRDGKRLASGALDGEIGLWDLDAGALLGVLTGHRGAVRAVRFHPDGVRLGSASWDGTVRLWNLASRSELKTIEGGGRRVFDLDFDPSGKLAAFGGDGGAVQVWDLERGVMQDSLRGHDGMVVALSWAPSGKILASGGGDSTARIWDAASGRELQVLRGHTSIVNAVAFSPDASRLASASNDSTFRVWRVDTGALAAAVSDHGAYVHGVAWSPDGGRLASVSLDQTVRLWRSDALGAEAAMGGHTGSAVGAAFSPDGRTLATASTDETVRIWDVETGEVRSILGGARAGLFAVAYGAGGLVAAGGAGKTIHLWDAETGARRGAFEGHTDTVYDLELAEEIGGRRSKRAAKPRDALLISGGVDRTVRVWRVSNGESIAVFTGHDAVVTGVSFSPGARLAASSSADGTIRIWDVRARRGVHVFRDAGPLNAVRFSPDGKAVAASGVDGTVKLWTLATREARVLGKHSARAYWLSFSRDGERVASASADGTARVWPISGGEAVVLRGARSEVNDAELSPDGRRVATTTDDGNVLVWDVAAGRPWWRSPFARGGPLEIWSHRGWSPVGVAPSPWREAIETRAVVASVAPGGKLLCIATFAGEIEMWDLAAERPLSSATAVAAVEQVEAFDGGCAVRAAGQVGLHSPDAAPRALEGTSASALAFSGGEILVAWSDGIAAYAAAGGTPRARYPASAGVTALARGERWIFAGYRDGNVERVPLAPGAPKPAASYEGVPSSAVVELAIGPMETLIAGFANGTAGIWDQTTGARLEQVRLHGSVAHLIRADAALHVITDLGDHAVRDLSVFTRDYCALIRDVWKEVPVVWDGGLIAARPPPAGHRCAE